MEAALKRMDDGTVDDTNKHFYLELLGKEWALLITQLFEGVDNPDVMSLSDLRRRIGDEDEEMRLRIEKEVEDNEFRLKRGSDLGRFDQFWDDHTLFECRYSRSKWSFSAKLQLCHLKSTRML